MSAIKSKYNAKIHKLIVDKVKSGVSRSDAFRLAGIHVDTGFAWLASGRREPAKYPQYVKLQADIEAAEAHAREKMTAVIVSSAEGKDERVSLDAAKFYLERRDPDNWGKKEKVEVDTGDKPLVQLNALVLVDGDAREASRALLRRVTGLSPDEPLGLSMGDGSQIDGEDGMEEFIEGRVLGTTEE